MFVRGRGFPIGEPKVMLFTRSGKWSEMLQRLRADYQLEAMCGVVCMYNMSVRSIFGACAGCKPCVAMEETGMGTMGQRTG